MNDDDEDKYLTGYTWKIPVYIRKKGVLQDVSAAAISAKVICLVGGEPTEVVAFVSQNSGETGADWGNGLVICKFSSTDTGSIENVANLYVEVKIDESGDLAGGRKLIQVAKGSAT